MIPTNNEELRNCADCRKIRCECPKTFGIVGPMNTTPEAWEKENVNPIVGYVFHSGRGLGQDNAPASMDWEYLREGTRRINELISQTRSEARIEAWERAKRVMIGLGLAGLVHPATLSEHLDRLIAEEKAKQTQAAPADART